VAGRFRPGIVHRLDRDTSGVLLVAKDNQVHGRLSEQFEARTVRRSTGPSPGGNSTATATGSRRTSGCIPSIGRRCRSAARGGMRGRP
jgi:hypothetical protein